MERVHYVRGREVGRSPWAPEQAAIEATRARVIEAVIEARGAGRAYLRTDGSIDLKALGLA